MSVNWTPEPDDSEFVRTALTDAGYDPDSFGQLDTGEQARILELARELHTESAQ